MHSRAIPCRGRVAGRGRGRWGARASHDAAPSFLQVKGHFSVPVQWLNLDELTDEYAIFSVWPTEQDRIAATHIMGMSDLEWAKVEGGKYYMSRAQYDRCNDQL